MKMHIVRQSLATNFQISFQITFCVDGLKLKSPADGRRRASQRDDGFTERACGRWKQWKALSLRRHSDVLLQKLLTSRLKLNNSSRADFQTQPFTILEPRYIRHRGSIKYERPFLIIHSDTLSLSLPKQCFILPTFIFFTSQNTPSPTALSSAPLSSFSSLPLVWHGDKSIWLSFQMSQQKKGDNCFVKVMLNP